MSTRARWLVGALALAAVVFLALSRRRPTTPEELIRERVVQMAHAAEEKQLGFLMDQVSTRFRSSEGFTRDELKAYLAGQLFGSSWLRVFTRDVEVREAGPTRVELSATFIFGRSRAASLRELARDSRFAAERVEATFEREADGVWRVVAAAHQPLSQEQLLRDGR